MDEATAKRVIALVLSYGPLPNIDVSPKGVFKRLLSDKKSVGGVPHFVLAPAIGQTEVVNNVPPEYVIGAVNNVRRMSKA